jgi:hypothetical protein
MAPKKDLYFPVKKIKGKAGKDVELVEAEVEKAPKRVRKLRGEKAITLIQPNKLTKKELQLIKQLKLKAKPEELPTKRKMEVYQGKMEKKQREELGRLESLKAIEQKRKMEQEERFGKPVQLPPEFYTLIQALAPEKLKKSKEQELPSVRMKMEQEEADKKLAKKMQDDIDKMQKEEESLAKRREQASFSEIAKILAEQRAEQLEEKESSEFEKLNKELDTEIKQLDLDKLPSYDETLELIGKIDDSKKDDPKTKKAKAEIDKIKLTNGAVLLDELQRLNPNITEDELQNQLDIFNKFPSAGQQKLLANLAKMKDVDDFSKLGNLIKYQMRLEELQSLERLKDEDDVKYFDRVAKKYVTTSKSSNNDTELAIPKGYKTATARAKAFEKILKKRQIEYGAKTELLDKELSGKGLIMKSKKGRGRPKKLKGGVISGAGFMDSISKAVDIGKKAIDTGKKVYEKGKDVYETGKKVYETGKQVYDVGKTAVETGKSVYKSFKGGELPKKGRGRPKKVKGGSMNFDEAMAKLTPEQRKMAMDQSMKNFGFGLPLEGGIMSGAGFMDTVTKAIDTGTKIYKKGKDVYETGKKVYDTGKQVYDVGKTAVETGKSAYKSFKGGELTKKDNKPSCYGCGNCSLCMGGKLPKKGKKQIRGGEFNLDSIFSPVALEGGILSAAGLQGGIISGAGVRSRGSGYTLPLPDPKSARATYQSYF